MPDDGRTAPPVTVHGGPEPVRPTQPAQPRAWSARTRLLVVAALVLLLMGYVATAVHASARRNAAIREAGGTRLALTGHGALPKQRGHVGADVQAAQVDLTLRNTGTVPLRLLVTTLDGAARRVDVGLSPGTERDVPVTWQVRCAEVGTLRGPRVLHVFARGRLRRHDVRLDVPESDGSRLTQLFHRAAVQVCAVLIEPRE